MTAMIMTIISTTHIVITTAVSALLPLCCVETGVLWDVGGEGLVVTPGTSLELLN